MKKVTGGGAPAVMWQEFMTSAVRRIAPHPIPGGFIDPSTMAPPQSIDDILSNLGPPTDEAATPPAEAQPDTVTDPVTGETVPAQ